MLVQFYPEDKFCHVATVISYNEYGASLRYLSDPGRIKLFIGTVLTLKRHWQLKHQNSTSFPSNNCQK